MGAALGVKADTQRDAQPADALGDAGRESVTRGPDIYDSIRRPFHATLLAERTWQHLPTMVTWSSKIIAACKNRRKQAASCNGAQRSIDGVAAVPHLRIPPAVARCFTPNVQLAAGL